MRNFFWYATALVALALFFSSLDGHAIVDAQNIKEIKGSSESLPQFLARFPASFEAQVFYGLAISAMVGLVGSWLWKWSQGAAKGWKHFTFRYVVGQVLWVIGGSVMTIATVGFQTDSGEFFGWMSVIVTGALMGFSGEIKTDRQRWSPSERIARREEEQRP